MTLSPDVSEGVLPPTPVVDTAAVADGRSPTSMAMRRFRRNIGAMAGMIVLGLILLLVAFGPLLWKYSPNLVDPLNARLPPSSTHWLGTNDTGQDIVARVLAGGRVSLVVGFSTAISALIIGTTLGIVSGRAGGTVDLIIMRITELFMAIPGILVVIVLAGILGPSIPLLIGMIALFAWPSSCRISRSVVMRVRELDYIQAAEAAGTRTWRILVRHLLPNVLPHVLVAGTMLVASAILAEAGLSYLGLGVSLPSASWGNSLEDARSFTVITQRPWMWVPAGVSISLTTLSVIFIGDGLRDALDPKAAT